MLQGRCTINNETFRLFHRDEVQEKQIESEKHLEDILEEFFGIKL